MSDAPSDPAGVFSNEPLLEFRRAENREAATRALSDLDARLPLEVPIKLGRKDLKRRPFDSLDPCAPERIVARAHGASAEDVGTAVEVAAAAYRDWSRRSGPERAEILRAAATLMRERRLELAALAVRETGKPWAEADADVCEAIDFIEYYTLGAVALDEGKPLIQVPGERNSLRYVGRGVCAVIAPWNFPFAIVTGMTSAALATGNAVILKPAEQAPACAARVVDAMHKAGVPREVLQLLPGDDEPAKALVASPGVQTIAFTGSQAAGLSIIETAAKMAPGQRHVKRVVAEMGGKNCIVVDSDADLDEVVPGVLDSAFGFAGQKCSAASRVLVHEDIAGPLTERLAGAIETLLVGPADDFATDVPAVIDRESQERLAKAIASAELAPRVSVPGPDGGFYVSPTLFVDLPMDSSVATEELFGPVLSLHSVADVETAMAIVEDSSFALTGGLFSRSPRRIAEASAGSPVGNLYINRDTTGAKVGRQPFGGCRLSGTGPQAGGPDYLLQFVEDHTVTENTMRHGLAV